MQRLCWIFLILLLVSTTAAGQGPQVVVDHDKVSINVESMRLDELLRLWDQATGMRSSVPPALANRMVTLELSGLTENQAVRSIFQKSNIDYVFIEGQGIVVTGASLAPATPAAADSADDDAAAEMTTEAVPAEESAEDIAELRRLQPPRQPKLIPTPFGPIPDSGRNLMIQLPPVLGEVASPPFFAPPLLLQPPAGAANGPVENNLFAPISIYRNPALPPINSRP